MQDVALINKTGVFYNPFLERHLENTYHIEQPARTRNTYIKLLNLLGDRVNFFISNEMISRESLELVHDKKYVDSIMRYKDIKKEIFLDPDTIIGENSVECAILSASLCVKAGIEVMEGNLNNAFALTRPPGHHACSNRAMGFCIFNNIAITAGVLMKEYNLTRVAIVDFDVHHGNGTQEIFYDSDKVLFISTHRYPFYPGTGYFNQIGRGDGIGFTVNIPLPEGTGDNDFAYVYTNLVGKILKKFEPEILLVSAGFDAHFSDPLGGMTLTDTGFRHIVNVILKSSGKGKVVFMLEGGYNTETLPSTVYTTVEEMTLPTNGEVITPVLSDLGEEILEEFNKYINNYWNIL
ncbi:MAG: histone deacetylase [Brevinematia bacterium]